MNLLPENIKKHGQFLLVLAIFVATPIALLFTQEVQTFINRAAPTETTSTNENYPAEMGQYAEIASDKESYIHQFHQFSSWQTQIEEDMTAEAWVSFTGQPGDTFLKKIITFQYRAEGTQNPTDNYLYDLAYEKSSEREGLRFEKENTETERQFEGFAPFNFETGQWYHVAATYEGSTIELFVNGEKLSTNTVEKTYDRPENVDVTRAFRIGYDYNDNCFPEDGSGAERTCNPTKDTGLNLLIDELRISTLVRDVQTNWQAGLYSQPLENDKSDRAVFGHWHFDGDGGDSSRREAQLTEKGDVAYKDWPEAPSSADGWTVSYYADDAFQNEVLTQNVVYKNSAGEKIEGIQARFFDDIELPSDMPHNYFTVIWEKDVEFEKGTYNFHTFVDDHADIWIDGRQAYFGNRGSADDGQDYGDHTFSYTFDTAGKHNVKVEYLQDTGSARFDLEWEKGDPGENVEITDWRGEYYSGVDIHKVNIEELSPTLVRNDESIDFRWGAGSPHPSVSGEFSARWTKDVEFEKGNYLFQVFSDDHMRVMIDSDVVIDKAQYNGNDYGTAAKLYTIPETGTYPVTVTFSDTLGSARAELSWQFQGGQVGEAYTNIPDDSGNQPPETALGEPGSETAKEGDTEETNPPSVTIANIEWNQTLSGTVALEAQAENLEPDSMEFLIDDKPLDTEITANGNTYTANWNTENHTDTLYALGFVAYNQNGKSFRARPVIVSVDNSQQGESNHTPELRTTEVTINRSYRTVNFAVYAVDQDVNDELVMEIGNLPWPLRVTSCSDGSSQNQALHFCRVSSSYLPSLMMRSGEHEVEVSIGDGESSTTATLNLIVR